MRSTSTYLFTISCVAVLGCGDDNQPPPQCGPGDAPADGIAATASGVTLTYTGLEGGLNNDCPDPSAPAGIVSLTIHGTQSDGTGQITMCISRPDDLANKSLALGPDVATSEVRLVDLEGTSGTCTFTLSNSITGMVSTTGLCGNGAAGFVLILDATVAMARDCIMGTVDVHLAGRAAVVTQ